MSYGDVAQRQRQAPQERPSVGSNPTFATTQGSFNGRTLAFGASYLGSSPSP